MSRLPVCSGTKAVRAFERLGYAVDHQTGSHILVLSLLSFPSVWERTELCFLDQ